MKSGRNWGRLGMTFETVTFEEITINYDKKRVPLSTKQRESIKGDYRYYGAQGVNDYIDDYIFDGKYLLIAEDGENLKSKKQNIAQLAEGKFWVNNHAHIVQCNSKCRIEYLCYLINSMDLSGYITGSAQPKLSQANINKISFRIPTIEQQDLILSVLIPIEKKINLNNQINENLEQQAQAIFKSWFVDFEPFGGVMPEDWKIGMIKDIIELHDSKRIPLSGSEREKMDKIYPYYGATSCMDYVDNYIFDGKYLLLGEDGTVIDKNGYPILQYVEGKFWVNNHAHIITGKLGYTVEILYLLFKKTNVKHIVTGAVQPKISQANLKKVPVTISSIKDLDAFNNIIQPIFAMIRKNRNENEKLALLRDTLLPKLMNGEIDVSEVKI